MGSRCRCGCRGCRWSRALGCCRCTGVWSERYCAGEGSGSGRDDGRLRRGDAGSNSSLAVAAGSPATISASNLQEYLSAIGESEMDQTLMTTYLQGSPGWVDHLIQVYGMKFVLATTFVCYYNVPGAQGTGLQVSPTGGGPGVSAAGAGIIQTLNAAVTSKGGSIMTSTPAVALYRDATGRVLGLQATSGASTINIQATKGVVLAAGGYDHNTEMMENYQRGPVHFTSAAVGNTGDGILMAMAAGADIRNMNNVWGCPHYNTPTGGVADRGHPWKTRSDNR